MESRKDKIEYVKVGHLGLGDVGLSFGDVNGGREGNDGGSDGNGGEVL